MASLLLAASDRPRVWILILSILAATLQPISSAIAQSSMEQLEWIHPNPEEVKTFRLLYAFTPAEREQPAAIEVGRPLHGDHFVSSFSVPKESSIWVAVDAVGTNGLVSEPSQWRRYDWRPGQGPLGRPGRPYLVQEPLR